MFLAHFAVRSFELLGRNIRCVYELSQRFVAGAKIIPKRCELCVSFTLCSEVFPPNFLVEITGVFAIFCTSLFEAPNVFEKGAGL